MEFRGLDQVHKSLTGLPKVVEREIFRGMREHAIVVRRVAKAEAPVGATGILRRRISIRSDRARMTVRVKSTAPHSHLVTKGRRAGKMPPPEALKEWARMMGLEGKEFLLARAIGRRGTVGVPFMERAQAVTTSGLEPRMRAAMERATAEFARP